MKDKRTNFPQKKTDQIDQYKDLLNESKAAYLINYKGTSVEQITNLRKNLTAQGDKLKILKNRLAKLAVKDTNYSNLGQFLTSDNAIVLSNGDVVTTAKTLTDVIKDIDSLKIVSGVISENKEQVLSIEQVLQLSKLPSKEVLIAQLLGAINGTTVKFARTLNEPVASLARALSQLAQKN